MDLKLYYKDPTWDADCWAVVDSTDPSVIIASGLTAPEAMRRCNRINHKNERWGDPKRVEVKMLEYPGTPVPEEK